jgi:hypothetical protein
MIPFFKGRWYFSYLPHGFEITPLERMTFVIQTQEFTSQPRKVIPEEDIGNPPIVFGDY